MLNIPSDTRSLEAWRRELNRQKEFSLHQCKIDKSMGFLTLKEYQESVQFINYHFGKCLELIDYLLSDKYDKTKFMIVLKQAPEKLLSEEGEMIYDPVIKKFLVIF